MRYLIAVMLAGAIAVPALGWAGPEVTGNKPAGNWTLSQAKHGKKVKKEKKVKKHKRGGKRHHRGKSRR